MKFSELKLHPQIMRAVEANSFEECTDIQSRAIPEILKTLDVAGLAQTGTGKTAAFMLPLLDRVVRSQSPTGEEEDKRCFPQWKPTNFILVLVPTRELAEQVYDNFRNFGAPAGLKAVSVYGGTSYEPQKKAIKEGVQFVIATPGRLIDLFKDHVVDLGQVRAVVFDEADRMFDMGFKDDMKYILRRVPKDRQFLVFSATLNFEVLEVAYEFGSNPVEVNVSKDQPQADNVEDEIFHVGQEDKAKYLLSLFKKHKPRQAIIFSNFRFNVERVAKFLSANGLPAMGISSLLTQSQRNRVMGLFREDNDQNILVATDLAARGLDIKGVDMVINFELPDDPENYVHRIGRTGRAGATGVAFSLVSDRDVEALQRIESYLNKKMTIGWLEDGELISDFKDFPKEERRGFKARPSKPSGKSTGGPSFKPRQKDFKDSRSSGNGGHPPRKKSKYKGKGRPHESSTQDSAQEARPSHPHKKKSSPKGSGGHKRKSYKYKPRPNANGGSNAHKYTPKNRQSGAGKGQAQNKGLGGRIAGFFKKLIGE